MRGHHTDQVVHEHRGSAGTLTGGDDELLRAGGRGIPRGVQARHRGSPGAIHDQVTVGIELDL